MMSKTDIEKDLELLKNLIRETSLSVDTTGARMMSFNVYRAKDVELCQFIFAQHGIKMYRYKSALCEHDMLRISVEDIDKLSPNAREFLWATDMRNLAAHKRKMSAKMHSAKQPEVAAKESKVAEAYKACHKTRSDITYVGLQGCIVHTEN